MIPVIGLVVGVTIGLLLQPTVPSALQPYVPIAIIAALDAVLGAARAYMEGRFDDRVFVVSSLVSGEVPSTKAAAESLASVSTAKNVLVVAERSDELTWKSLRNVPSVHLLEPGQLNTYDVLVSDDVVFTQGALETFLAGPVKGKSAKASATSTEAASTEGEEA